MIRRFAIALMATPLLLTLHVETASAAPPSNDTFAGATPVMLGFSEELDTSEATTDADDVQLSNGCTAATDASVWYAFTSPVDAQVSVFIFGSSYDAEVVVGVGTQGNLEQVACGHGVTFLADGGVTYYVLAVDDQTDGGGNGGILRIAFIGAPTPTGAVTANPVGRFDSPTGVATISGTYTCTAADSVLVSGFLRQDRGRFTVDGSFNFVDEGTCDGTPRDWSTEVVPENGTFSGGKALATVFVTVCGPFQCFSDLVEQTVQLRGGAK
jgi:Family of unknown function (DUF6299)